MTEMIECLNYDQQTAIIYFMALKQGMCTETRRCVCRMASLLCTWPHKKVTQTWWHCCWSTRLMLMLMQRMVWHRCISPPRKTACQQPAYSSNIMQTLTRRQRCVPFLKPVLTVEFITCDIELICGGATLCIGVVISQLASSVPKRALQCKNVRQAVYITVNKQNNYWYLCKIVMNVAMVKVP